MPRIKVVGGTPNHSTRSLCLTCRRATVVRGQSLSSEIIRCHALERTMDFPVTDCDSYDDRAQPSLWDLKEIAWALVTDRLRSGSTTGHGLLSTGSALPMVGDCRATSRRCLPSRLSSGRGIG